MAAQTGAAGAAPSFFVQDADGNETKIVQPESNHVVPTIRIGLSGSGIRLTQQNVTDILPHLTNFSTTGILS